MSNNNPTRLGGKEMERLEGGRIKIVGVAPGTREQEMAPRRPRFMWREDAKMAVREDTETMRYFSEVHYHNEVSSIQEFQPHTIYHGFNENLINAPRMRAKENLFIPGNGNGLGRAAYAVTGPPTFRRQRLGEKVYVIKFGDKPFYRGYFYAESKTLILGDLIKDWRGLEWFKRVIEALVDHGMLEDIEGEGGLLDEEPVVRTRKVVEFHQGQRVFIQLPLPQKEVTVGCDPEYEYVTHEGLDYRVDSAPRSLGGTGATEEIGRDGAGSQVEIRPKPFTDPADVVSYMIGIMMRLAPNAHFSTRGNRYAVGGHIHIGIGNSYRPPDDLNWLMDYFLGIPTSELNGTARSGYARLSAWESKPWGFEYRSAPAAIFHWPEFARLSMKALKGVCEAYMNARTIIVNSVPEFSDYWNYCRFTPREYERWRMYLDRYHDFMRNPEALAENCIANWTNDETIAQFPSQVHVPTEEERRVEAERLAGVAETERVQREAQEENNRIRRELSDSLTLARHNEDAYREHNGSRSIRISCSDDWVMETLLPFRETLTRRLVEEGIAEGEYFIFGLRRDRGQNVYGYQSEGFGRLPHDAVGQTGGFGVPASVRMAAGVSASVSAIAHAEAIVNAICYREPEQVVVEGIAEEADDLIVDPPTMHPRTRGPGGDL